MTDDLISRQAILDAVDGVTWYHQNKNGEMVHGANSAEHQAWYKAEDIYTAIESVPSAQLAQDLPKGCTDTISRADVDLLIEEAQTAWLKGDILLMYPTLKKGLQKIPPVTPKQPGWIPTSERLPDNDRAVLVTLKWAEDDYEVAVGEYWHNSTASHGWGSFEGHVIAWHELPTPYREGGQDGKN